MSSSQFEAVTKLKFENWVLRPKLLFISKSGIFFLDSSTWLLIKWHVAKTHSSCLTIIIFFRKLQSKPLKFWVIWILHLKIWKFIFYTLKFPSVSKSIYFVSWLTLTCIIKWHVGSWDTLVRKVITVNLVSLDLISHRQVGAVTDGETELKAENDEGLWGFKKYVTGLGFYFLANSIVE